MTFTEVGVDYCLAHHGLRNEDEEWCDWRDDDDNVCEDCDGLGYEEQVDSEDAKVDCEDCDGYGFTPCDLASLGYMKAGS